MKKWLRLFLWIGLIAYLTVSFGFVAENSRNAVCDTIRVTILDSAMNRFLRKSEVKDLMLEDQKELLGRKFSKINKGEIEKLVNNQAFVKDANVFATIDGTLHVELKQRKPVLRVVNGKRESYYIDSQGIIFPLSRNYTSRVLIANGFIFEPFEWREKRELVYPGGEMGKRARVIYDLYKLADFISKDELWRSQIAQIFVNSKYEFELIPRVGAHIIYLGDISDFEEKFRNLQAMYLHGFSNAGWNQYHIINLKFKNQVVCTKR